jgi:Reeler domain
MYSLCIEIGEAAPGPPHRGARNPIFGPLKTAGFIVKIGADIVDPDVPIAVEAGTDYKITVTSLSGQQQFRGTLIILSKPATLMLDRLTLPADSVLRMSDICPDVARSGVTHQNNELKTSVETTMKFDKAYGEVLLDVNVVVVNREISQGGSYFYWSQFKLNVAGGVTAAPVAAPIKKPKCGLFRRGLFCPFTACGFFGRLIYGKEFCVGFYEK